MKPVKVKPVRGEFDIPIELPGGFLVTLQYRNYEGGQKTGLGASLDIILPRPLSVYNWIGVGMFPAPCRSRRTHIRLADQLCVLIE